mgnify:CR=1 FL=1
MPPCSDATGAPAQGTEAIVATLESSAGLGLVEDSEPPVVLPYLHTPAELLGGGTTEIQLNIIAQMVLGLPRK